MKNEYYKRESDEEDDCDFGDTDEKVSGAATLHHGGSEAGARSLTPIGTDQYNPKSYIQSQPHHQTKVPKRELKRS